VEFSQYRKGKILFNKVLWKSKSRGRCGSLRAHSAAMGHAEILDIMLIHAEGLRELVYNRISIYFHVLWLIIMIIDKYRMKRGHLACVAISLVKYVTVLGQKSLRTHFSQTNSPFLIHDNKAACR